MLDIDDKIIDSRILIARVEAKAALHSNDEETLFRIGVDLERKLEQLHEHFQYMSNIWEIKEQPISSHRRMMGKIIVLMKRVFRKLTRWLFQSYYMQTSQFNLATVHTIADMIRIQEMLVDMQRKREE